MKQEETQAWASWGIAIVIGGLGAFALESLRFGGDDLAAVLTAVIAYAIATVSILKPRDLHVTLVSALVAWILGPIIIDTGITSTYGLFTGPKWSFLLLGGLFWLMPILVHGARMVVPEPWWLSALVAGVAPLAIVLAFSSELILLAPLLHFAVVVSVFYLLLHTHKHTSKKKKKR